MDTRATAVLKAGNNAVITGGASGIGLAAAQRFAAHGLNVALADLSQEKLDEAVRLINEQTPDVNAQGYCCDVSDFSQVRDFANSVSDEFGDVSILMSNAGTLLPTGKSWENIDQWRKLVDINLWGVIHGVQAFVPSMLESGKEGIVVNTGSKQGITKPPSAFAYNLSKAGVIAFTEGLAHDLRSVEESKISAHLLVPGFTYTGMISQFLPEKPAEAWTSDEVVDFPLKRLDRGDFYIICPDNDVSEEMDAKRIQWYADDLIQGRPALSRWHPDFADAFKAHMES